MADGFFHKLVSEGVGLSNQCSPFFSENEVKISIKTLDVQDFKTAIPGCQTAAGLGASITVICGEELNINPSISVTACGRGVFHYM